MLKKYKYIILFFLPIVLKIIVNILIAKAALFNIFDIVEDVVFSFLIFFFLLNIPAKDKTIKVFLHGVYILYFILEISSLLITESNFSASYIYSLLDSNSSELFNFIQSYISLMNTVFIVVLLGVYILLNKNHYLSVYKPSLRVKVLVGLLIVFILKFTGSIENNAYYNIVRGAFGYYQLNSILSSTASIDTSKVFSTLNNDVLVVVIGESIAKRHMQIYNYDKATTPLLYKCKDSLMVYNNVIAPDVLTAKVIPKLFTTLSNSEIIEKYDNIIEILNKANYDTYWISNQRPIGFHENVVSKLVSVSNHIKFLSYKNHLEKTNFDNVVIPVLKEILAKKEKKVVFVHLIGAHFNYGNRYPKEFEKFVSNNENDNNQDVINQYDNAVLYEDFIVYSILKNVKSLKQKSAVLYLSDHGEDVFDESNFAGHTEAGITESMLEIPFILWKSNDYELPTDFEFVADRAFMTDHFYSSLGHLLGVSYPSINNEQSIFSKSFQNRDRIIMDTINYDLNNSKANE
jgi:heptose-I-phosphate ethanolaminephosphotransferase